VDFVAGVGFRFFACGFRLLAGPVIEAWFQRTPIGDELWESCDR